MFKGMNLAFGRKSRAISLAGPQANIKPVDPGELMRELPRGVSGRSLEEHQTPAAQFAVPERIASSPAFSHTDSKLFLGVIGGRCVLSNGQYHVVGGTPIGYGDDRHAVLCAGSRAGKGRSYLVPTLLEYGGSVLALDPKGELADITARRRQELGQRVFIVDPFGVTSPRHSHLRAGFNPMNMLRETSPSVLEDAGLIADALVPTEGHDPHWDDSARALVEGLLLHVATWAGFAGERDLATVREVLLKGVGEDEKGNVAAKNSPLKAEMLANALVLAERGLEEISSAIEGACNDFFERPQGERGSVLSTARRHTKFLDYPPIKASLRTHGFDLEDLKRAPRGMTVYLCLPAGRMNTCSRWFRLFVNLALEAMEREKTMPKIPVLAVLEEFNVLGSMRQLEVAAGMLAGFGMKLLIVLQDLTQLKRHYKDGWETFLGNAGTMIFFGNSDLTTLEFISKRCGTTSLIVDRQSDVTTSQRTGGQTGKSWSLEVRELLTAEEAARFFGRDDDQQRALVIRAGRPTTMVVQRVKYDSHEMFAGKWDRR